MDTGFDKNKTELAVLVLAVTLKVLANRDGLFGGLLLGETMHSYHQKKKKIIYKTNSYLSDQEVKVLWKLGSEAC